MNVPRETKIWVGFWAALSATWLFIALGNAIRSDWSNVWDALASGLIAGYVASLIYERDKAREFRNRFVRAVSGGRWMA